MSAKLNVSLTQSYRLSSDGERNFTIEQLVTVDPTKAPGWSAKVAADPTLSAEVRHEWRDTGNYFAMTARGLAAALEFVALRQAIVDATTEDGGMVTLSEFAQSIRDYSEGLRDAVSGLIYGEVSA